MRTVQGKVQYEIKRRGLGKRQWQEHVDVGAWNEETGQEVCDMITRDEIMKMIMVGNIDERGMKLKMATRRQGRIEVGGFGWENIVYKDGDREIQWKGRFEIWKWGSDEYGLRLDGYGNEKPRWEVWGRDENWEWDNDKSTLGLKWGNGTREVCDMMERRNNDNDWSWLETGTREVWNQKW